MSNVNSNIQINLVGNAGAQIANLQGGLNGLANTANRLDTAFGTAFQSAFAFNNITQALDSFKNTLSGITTPLVDFDRKSREMQAITNSSAEELDKLKSSAKDLASEFGTSASSNVEMFKVALSKLTPELGQSNDFMKAFGTSANQLAMTMYGDVDGATKAITNSLNQYGVDLSNPIEATQKMQEMMDLVAKSAQVGAVEVPGIANALQLTGNMAYNAGVKFEQLQGLIQVTGKFAEEGRIGYVLRDIFQTMNKGDFIPKEVMGRMQGLGVNLQALQNPSVDVRTKLVELQKVLKDPSAFNQLFGQYANEAGALVRNIGLYDEYMVKMDNAQGSLDQMSKTISKSYDVQMKKANEWVNNFKISIGEATGMVLPFAEISVGYLSSVLQFAGGIHQAKLLIDMLTASTRMQALWTSISTITTNIFTFSVNALGVAFRFATGPIGIAIMAVGAITAGVIYAWKNFEGFRGFLYGLWNSVKVIFGSIKAIVSDVFGGISQMIQSVINGDWNGFVAGMGKFAGGVGKGVMASMTGGGSLILDNKDKISKSFADGRLQAHSEFSKEKRATESSKNKGVLSPVTALATGGKMENLGTSGKITSLGKSTAHSGSSNSGGGGSGKNVKIEIAKLIENLNLQVTNLKEGKEEIKRIITETVVAAISDAESAIAIG